MKRQIVIIEDNYYKFFATKQLLESKLKLEVSIEKRENLNDLRYITKGIGPQSVIDRPKDGVEHILKTLKKRNINRRNCEILFILIPWEYSSTAAA
tara:strand:+ start:2391 stop:2678 length:288 start_codon:yes stop_codon:yes gene_type:complete